MKPLCNARCLLTLLVLALGPALTSRAYADIVFYRLPGSGGSVALEGEITVNPGGTAKRK